jgi:hypothetical protein
MSEITIRPPPQPTVTNFQPINSGALRGFCDVALPSGMVLLRCGIFSKDGRCWALPPSKQVIGRDGAVQRNPDGKAKYEPTVSFTDRATADRWSTAVIEAFLVAHPGALA